MEAFGLALWWMGFVVMMEKPLVTLKEKMLKNNVNLLRKLQLVK
jgi:hypothetical protein